MIFAAHTFHLLYVVSTWALCQHPCTMVTFCSEYMSESLGTQTDICAFNFQPFNLTYWDIETYASCSAHHWQEVVVCGEVVNQIPCGFSNISCHSSPYHSDIRCSWYGKCLCQVILFHLQRHDMLNIMPVTNPRTLTPYSVRSFCCLKPFFRMHIWDFQVAFRFWKTQVIWTSGQETVACNTNYVGLPESGSMGPTWHCWLKISIDTCLMFCGARYMTIGSIGRDQ